MSSWVIVESNLLALLLLIAASREKSRKNLVLTQLFGPNFYSGGMICPLKYGVVAGR